MAIIIDAVLKRRLHEHIGHRIEIVAYGADGEEEVAVECMNCNETLISAKAVDEDLAEADKKAINAFRANLVSRLRDHQEMCHEDPESAAFKAWLSENCSEAELAMMAAWEDEVGARAARLYLRACQLEAQK